MAQPTKRNFFFKFKKHKEKAQETTPPSTTQEVITSTEPNAPMPVKKSMFFKVRSKPTRTTPLTNITDCKSLSFKDIENITEPISPRNATITTTTKITTIRTTTSIYEPLLNETVHTNNPTESPNTSPDDTMDDDEITVTANCSSASLMNFDDVIEMITTTALCENDQTFQPQVRGSSSISNTNIAQDDLDDTYDDDNLAKEAEEKAEKEELKLTIGDNEDDDAEYIVDDASLLLAKQTGVLAADATEEVKPASEPTQQSKQFVNTEYTVTALENNSPSLNLEPVGTCAPIPKTKATTHFHGILGGKNDMTHVTNCTVLPHEESRLDYEMTSSTEYPVSLNYYPEAPKISLATSSLNEDPTSMVEGMDGSPSDLQQFQTKSLDVASEMTVLETQATQQPAYQQTLFQQFNPGEETSGTPSSIFQSIVQETTQPKMETTILEQTTIPQTYRELVPFAAFARRTRQSTSSTVASIDEFGGDDTITMFPISPIFLDGEYTTPEEQHFLECSSEGATSVRDAESPESAAPETNNPMDGGQMMEEPTRMTTEEADEVTSTISTAKAREDEEEALAQDENIIPKIDNLLNIFSSPETTDLPTSIAQHETDYGVSGFEGQEVQNLEYQTFPVNAPESKLVYLLPIHSSLLVPTDEPVSSEYSENFLQPQIASNGNLTRSTTEQNCSSPSFLSDDPMIPRIGRDYNARTPRELDVNGPRDSDLAIGIFTPPMDVPSDQKFVGITVGVTPQNYDLASPLVTKASLQFTNQHEMPNSIEQSILDELSKEMVSMLYEKAQMEFSPTIPQDKQRSVSPTSEIGLLSSRDIPTLHDSDCLTIASTSMEKIISDSILQAKKYADLTSLGPPTTNALNLDYALAEAKLKLYKLVHGGSNPENGGCVIPFCMENMENNTPKPTLHPKHTEPELLHEVHGSNEGNEDEELHFSTKLIRPSTLSMVVSTPVNAHESAGEDELHHFPDVTHTTPRSTTTIVPITPSTVGTEVKIEEQTPSTVGTEVKIEEQTPSTVGTEVKLEEQTPSTVGTEVKIEEQTEPTSMIPIFMEICANDRYTDPPKGYHKEVTKHTESTAKANGKSICEGIPEQEFHHFLTTPLPREFIHVNEAADEQELHHFITTDQDEGTNQTSTRAAEGKSQELTGAHTKDEEDEGEEAITTASETEVLITENLGPKTSGVNGTIATGTTVRDTGEMSSISCFTTPTTRRKFIHVNEEADEQEMHQFTTFTPSVEDKGSTIASEPENLITENTQPDSKQMGTTEKRTTFEQASEMPIKGETVEGKGSSAGRVSDRSETTAKNEDEEAEDEASQSTKLAEVATNLSSTSQTTSSPVELITVRPPLAQRSECNNPKTMTSIKVTHECITSVPGPLVVDTSSDEDLEEGDAVLMTQCHGKIASHNPCVQLAVADDSEDKNFDETRLNMSALEPPCTEDEEDAPCEAETKTTIHCPITCQSKTSKCTSTTTTTTEATTITTECTTPTTTTEFTTPTTTTECTTPTTTTECTTPTTTTECTTPATTTEYTTTYKPHEKITECTDANSLLSVGAVEAANEQLHFYKASTTTESTTTEHDKITEFTVAPMLTDVVEVAGNTEAHFHEKKANFSAREDEEEGGGEMRKAFDLLHGLNENADDESIALENKKDKIEDEDDLLSGRYESSSLVINVPTTATPAAAIEAASTNEECHEGEGGAAEGSPSSLKVIESSSVTEPLKNHLQEVITDAAHESKPQEAPPSTSKEKPNVEETNETQEAINENEEEAPEATQETLTSSKGQEYESSTDLKTTEPSEAKPEENASKAGDSAGGAEVRRNTGDGSSSEVFTDYEEDSDSDDETTATFRVQISERPTSKNKTVISYGSSTESLPSYSSLVEESSPTTAEATKRTTNVTPSSQSVLFPKAEETTDDTVDEDEISPEDKARGSLTTMVTIQPPTEKIESTIPDYYIDTETTTRETESSSVTTEAPYEETQSTKKIRTTRLRPTTLKKTQPPVNRTATADLCDDHFYITNVTEPDDTLDEESTLTAESVRETSKDISTTSEGISTQLAVHEQIDGNVSKTADDISTTAEDISTTAEDISTTAEDISTTAEDISTTAEDNSTTAEDISTTAEDISTPAEDISTQLSLEEQGMQTTENVSKISENVSKDISTKLGLRTTQTSENVNKAAQEISTQLALAAKGFRKQKKYRNKVGKRVSGMDMFATEGLNIADLHHFNAFHEGDNTICAPCVEGEGLMFKDTTALTLGARQLSEAKQFYSKCKGKLTGKQKKNVTNSKTTTQATTSKATTKISKVSQQVCTILTTLTTTPLTLGARKFKKSKSKTQKKDPKKKNKGKPDPVDKGKGKDSKKKNKGKADPADKGKGKDSKKTNKGKSDPVDKGKGKDSKKNNEGKPDPVDKGKAKDSKKNNEGKPDSVDKGKEKDSKKNNKGKSDPVDKGKEKDSKKKNKGKPDPVDKGKEKDSKKNNKGKPDPVPKGKGKGVEAPAEEVNEAEMVHFTSKDENTICAPCDEDKGSENKEEISTPPPDSGKKEEKVKESSTDAPTTTISSITETKATIITSELAEAPNSGQKEEEVKDNSTEAQTSTISSTMETKTDIITSESVEADVEEKVTESSTEIQTSTSEISSIIDETTTELSETAEQISNDSSTYTKTSSTEISSISEEYRTDALAKNQTSTIGISGSIGSETAATITSELVEFPAQKEVTDISTEGQTSSSEISSIIDETTTTELVETAEQNTSGNSIEDQDSSSELSSINVETTTELVQVAKETGTDAPTENQETSTIESSSTLDETATIITSELVENGVQEEVTGSTTETQISSSEISSIIDEITTTEIAETAEQNPTDNSIEDQGSSSELSGINVETTTELIETAKQNTAISFTKIEAPTTEALSIGDEGASTTVPPEIVHHVAEETGADALTEKQESSTIEVSSTLDETFTSEMSSIIDEATTTELVETAEENTTDSSTEEQVSTSTQVSGINVETTTPTTELVETAEPDTTVGSTEETSATTTPSELVETTIEENNTEIRTSTMEISISEQITTTIISSEVAGEITSLSDQTTAGPSVSEETITSMLGSITAEENRTEPLCVTQTTTTTDISCVAIPTCRIRQVGSNSIQSPAAKRFFLNPNKFFFCKTKEKKMQPKKAPIEEGGHGKGIEAAIEGLNDADLHHLSAMTLGARQFKKQKTLKNEPKLLPEQEGVTPKDLVTAAEGNNEDDLHHLTVVDKSEVTICAPCDDELAETATPSALAGTPSAWAETPLSAEVKTTTAVALGARQFKKKNRKYPGKLVTVEEEVTGDESLTASDYLEDEDFYQSIFEPVAPEITTEEESPAVTARKGKQKNKKYRGKVVKILDDTGILKVTHTKDLHAADLQHVTVTSQLGETDVGTTIDAEETTNVREEVTVKDLMTPTNGPKEADLHDTEDSLVGTTLGDEETTNVQEEVTRKDLVTPTNGLKESDLDDTEDSLVGTTLSHEETTDIREGVTRNELVTPTNGPKEADLDDTEDSLVRTTLSDEETTDIREEVTTIDLVTPTDGTSQTDLDDTEDSTSRERTSIAVEQTDTDIDEGEVLTSTTGLAIPTKTTKSKITQGGTKQLQSTTEKTNIEDNKGKLLAPIETGGHGRGLELPTEGVNDADLHHMIEVDKEETSVCSPCDDADDVADTTTVLALGARQFKNQKTQKYHGKLVDKGITEKTVATYIEVLNDADFHHLTQVAKKESTICAALEETQFTETAIPGTRLSVERTKALALGAKGRKKFKNRKYQGLKVPNKKAGKGLETSTMEIQHAELLHEVQNKKGSTICANRDETIVTSTLCDIFSMTITSGTKVVREPSDFSLGTPKLVVSEAYIDSISPRHQQFQSILPYLSQQPITTLNNLNINEEDLYNHLQCIPCGDGAYHEPNNQEVIPAIAFPGGFSPTVPNIVRIHSVSGWYPANDQNDMASEVPDSGFHLGTTMDFEERTDREEKIEEEEVSKGHHLTIAESLIPAEAVPMKHTTKVYSSAKSVPLPLNEILNGNVQIMSFDDILQQLETSTTFINVPVTMPTTSCCNITRQPQYNTAIVTSATPATMEPTLGPLTSETLFLTDTEEQTEASDVHHSEQEIHQYDLVTEPTTKADEDYFIDLLKHTPSKEEIRILTKSNTTTTNRLVHVFPPTTESTTQTTEEEFEGEDEEEEETSTCVPTTVTRCLPTTTTTEEETTQPETSTQQTTDATETSTTPIAESPETEAITTEGTTAITETMSSESSEQLWNWYANETRLKSEGQTHEEETPGVFTVASSSSGASPSPIVFIGTTDELQHWYANETTLLPFGVFSMQEEETPGVSTVVSSSSGASPSAISGTTDELQHWYANETPQAFGGVSSGELIIEASEGPETENDQVMFVKNGLVLDEMDEVSTVEGRIDEVAEEELSDRQFSSVQQESPTTTEVMSTTQELFEGMTLPLGVNITFGNISLIFNQTDWSKVITDIFSNNSNLSVIAMVNHTSPKIDQCPITINLPTYFPNCSAVIGSYEDYYTTIATTVSVFDDEDLDITVNPLQFRSMRLQDFFNITEFPTTQPTTKRNASAEEPVFTLIPPRKPFHVMPQSPKDPDDQQPEQSSQSLVKSEVVTSLNNHTLEIPSLSRNASIIISNESQVALPNITPLPIKPIEIKQDCNAKDFGISKNCMCSIDSLIGDLRNKTREKDFHQVLDSYLCPIVSKKTNITIGKDGRFYRRQLTSIDFIFRKPRKIKDPSLHSVFLEDIQLEDTDYHVYATPGSKIKIPCIGGSNNNNSEEMASAVWSFSDGTPLTEGKTQEKDGTLIIENIIPQDAGNYTCKNGGRKYPHQLSTVTLASYKIGADILYAFPGKCTNEYLELMYSSFPVKFEDMLCGESHSICYVNVTNKCLTKKTDYVMVAMQVVVEPLTVILPTLDQNDCKISCQQNIYAKIVSILLKNVEIFETLPIFYSLGEKKFDLIPTPAAKDGAKDKTQIPDMNVQCFPGFGLIESTHVCSACGKNMYSTGETPHCIKCPPKQYQPNEGSKSCLPCNTFLEDPACLPLPIEMNIMKFKILVGCLVTAVVLLIGVCVCLACKTKTGKDHFRALEEVRIKKRRQRQREFDRRDLNEVLPLNEKKPILRPTKAASLSMVPPPQQNEAPSPPPPDFL